MLSETAAEIQFPATCARCGARVAERVSFCPHCGTHARLAFGKSERKPQRPQTAAKERKEPAKERKGPAKERKEPSAARESGVPPWAPPQPLFAAGGDAKPFAGIAAPMRDFAADSGRQWGVKAGTAITLAAFVALFGSIVLLHRHDDASSPPEQQAPLRTAEGSVQSGALAHGTPAGNANDTRAAAPKPPAVAAVREQPKPPVAAPAAPVAPPPVAALAPKQAVPAQNTRPDLAQAPVEPPPAAANTRGPSAKVDAARDSGRSKEARAVARSQDNNSYASIAPKKSARRSASAYTDAAIPPQPAVPLLPGNVAPRNDIQQPAIGNSSYSANGPQAIQRANVPQERHQASADRSIALAQTSLAKGNLAAARRALDAAQAAQPGNSEAFMLQQDLVSRERARDSALNSARVCAVQQEWNCTWHQAGSALSIDAGSVEAKALVQRAMIESGAASRPPGPGADGPDVPLLAQ